MATTFQSFQSEMEQIRSKETAKQRLHTVVPPPEKPTAKGRKKDAPNEPVEVVVEDAGGDMLETDDIMAALLSRTQSGHEKARDSIAGLITRNHGEYVLRIGAHPPRSQLFDLDAQAGVSDDVEGWSGVEHSNEELDFLKDEITTTVEEVGGKACILFDTRQGTHPRLCILLRLPPPNVSLTPEVRCAVVGNVDSGKSTTLGVLTRGALDDGRGRARVALFRHKHEIETGRTSSVGMEILGFDPAGAPILPKTTTAADHPDTVRLEKLGWEDISKQAAKIVSFIDLAGHERYLKTTLYGLTSGAPSCVILTVGANAGLIGMSKEHLSIALALSVPVVVCITKVDMTPANVLAQTIQQVIKILKSPGCRKTPVFVKSAETAVGIATAFGKDRLCPIFQISNVSGLGLDHLRTFLNLLPSSEGDTDKFSIDAPLEYSVTDVWSVPYVGTVVNGILHSGSIKAGDSIYIGPDSNGNFQSTVVKTMQRKRANVTAAEAGQCVSLALKRIRRSAVRKGMVVMHKTEVSPKAHLQFEGQVLILYHNTTLQKNYQAMLHCGAVRQTVRIIDIMDHPQGILRTGDRATVKFEFISHPEFIKEGMKLLFREGKTKGLGVITKLLP